MPVDRCLHCRAPVPAGAGSAPFCCHGCAAVHALLVAQGLTRYYELAGDRIEPASGAERPAAPPAWLEPLVEAAERGAGELCRLDLDIQGIHCSACVWLVQELFRREPGGAEVVVNPALGRLALRYRRGAFDPAAWLGRVEAFGYRLGPPRKRPAPRALELPLRLGVSAALAIQLMLFSVSFYFGLAPDEHQLYGLFTWLSLALATAVVAVGGWPFVRSSWQGLRRGVLHLDLPIATGIVLVFASSLARLAGGGGERAYFDTLAVFITLMLAGRFFQERLLERNRRYLLEDDGVEGFVVRRLEGERLAARPAGAIRAGDRLLVAPGELVPVDAVLLAGAAAVSTDWIDGESEPRAAARGDRLAAGSFNAGRAAFHVAAATDFEASPLVGLLRASTRADRRLPHARLWDRVARFWVAGVAVLALAGYLVWLPVDPERALAVAAALLVVTCPCAIGIAIPLAYELTLQRLRRQGCYVRGADLLDRLVRVRRVVFDKTGTLTLGRLELAQPGRLAELDAAAREALYNLAVRSHHPASRAVVEAFAAPLPAYLPEAVTAEEPGLGVEGRFAGALWRLGSRAWAAPGAPGAGAALTRDGELVAALDLGERPRPDAARQLATLAASGLELWIVSGDAPAKVAAFAASLGLPAARAVGAATPQAKAAFVDALDRDDTLFLGDGVNDAPAFARAYAAGTPAIDRPVMPGRSDFFLVGESLAPLVELVELARGLRRVVHRLLAAAVVYNCGVVAAAFAGWITPLVAAVVMPASTLALVASTVAALAPAARRARGAAAGRLAEAAP